MIDVRCRVLQSSLFHKEEFNISLKVCAYEFCNCSPILGFLSKVWFNLVKNV